MLGFSRSLRAESTQRSGTERCELSKQLSVKSRDLFALARQGLNFSGDKNNDTGNILNIVLFFKLVARMGGITRSRGSSNDSENMEIKTIAPPCTSGDCRPTVTIP
jgi:hypothetical protein